MAINLKKFAKVNVFVQDEKGPFSGDVTIRIYWERVDDNNLKGWILSKKEWKIIDRQPESINDLMELQSLHEDISERPHDVVFSF